MLGKHALKGRRITRRPSKVYRYRPFEWFVDDLSKKLTALATDDALNARDLLHHLLQRAEEHGEWPELIRYVREDLWARPDLDLTLSKGPSMFVTFDPEGETVFRDSSSYLHMALALPKPRPPSVELPLLAEFAFAPSPADDLLYPTVADAGGLRYFRCAPPPEPHGWTQPHVTPGRTTPARQPEAVTVPLAHARVASSDFRVLGR